MPNERNYLDDLPGVSGYALGKFHLDDLDFADDPLKKKIDFIDDALLAPPKPGADITSGLKTSRQVMGERQAQPTDAVGMRPEDYIRRRPASHFHEEHEDRFAEERVPEPVKARARIRDVTEPPVRTAAESRTRPAGEALEEAYRRYKERKQAEISASPQRSFPGTAPVRGNVGTRAGRAAAGNTKQQSKALVIGVVIFFIALSQLITFLTNSSGESEVVYEPSGFAGQTNPEVVVDPVEDMEMQWQNLQDVFAMICENPETAEEYVGLTLYDIGITDEMREYLVDNADTVSEEDERTVYETQVNEYDIDYYEYEEYAWLRFWSNEYEDVADIAFYYEDMVIQVIDVNGERMAELE